MKKILSLGLLCLSVSTFASVKGTPDQDPVVAYARSLFDDGQEPTAGFLLNNKFDCAIFSAVKNDFEKDTEEGVSFQRKGKIYTSEELDESLFFVRSSSSDELIASTSVSKDGETEVNYVAMRMNTDEKVLVIEASKLVEGIDDEEKSAATEAKYAPALADILSGDAQDTSVAVATSYTICTISE